MTNLAENLLESARQVPHRPAIRLLGDELNYRELAVAARRVAEHLRSQGVRPGERVCVMLPNVVEFAALYYGCLLAGVVVVPMNPLLKAREVGYYVRDSGACLLFGWHECADAATAGASAGGAPCVLVHPDRFLPSLPDVAALPGTPEPVDRADTDTAVILYTSGTTGSPKGAELTHANLRENAKVMSETALLLSSSDVVLGALPLFHTFGQTCAMNTAVLTGACLALVPRFDPELVLRIIERDRVTVFEGVPTMYSALLQHARTGRFDAGSLRVCVSGGAGLPVEVLHAFEKAFGCVILEGYGLSETSPVAAFNHLGAVRKPGSIGTPVRGVEMRLFHEPGSPTGEGPIGEIAVKGHNVMKGYWGRLEDTAEAIRDGWFHTGDLARVDEDGYFYIVDRKKDVIIRGGYNVYPREVEEVLYEHPAVAEAAVVGIPDAHLGEEVGAAVALRPKVTATPQELVDHVRGQLAAYKYPRHVWIVDALPKGPTGKILKREIRPPERTVPRAASPAPNR